MAKLHIHRCKETIDEFPVFDTSESLQCIVTDNEEIFIEQFRGRCWGQIKFHLRDSFQIADEEIERATALLANSQGATFMVNRAMIMNETVRSLIETSIYPSLL
jgi:hypothetical protein